MTGRQRKRLSPAQERGKANLDRAYKAISADYAAFRQRQRERGQQFGAIFKDAHLSRRRAIPYAEVTERLLAR